MRRASKVDANQSEIVHALRKAGATVQPLHAVGGGVPDLLVGVGGRNFLCEIKDGNKPPSKRKLTPDQIEFHRDWRGSIHVFLSVDDALQWLSAERISDA